MVDNGDPGAGHRHHGVAYSHDLQYGLQALIAESFAEPTL
jgi:hypothetical protein